MQPKEEFEQSIQAIDQALGEIERTLEQMLTLAQLSASDLNVDREVLQRHWNASSARSTASPIRFSAIFRRFLQ